MKTLVHYQLNRWHIAIEFKLADLWIGAFYKKAFTAFDLWVCLLPCLPIHITIYAPER
jgi:hypothetical protein